MLSSFSVDSSLYGLVLSSCLVRNCPLICPKRCGWLTLFCQSCSKCRVTGFIQEIIVGPHEHLMSPNKCSETLLHYYCFFCVGSQISDSSSTRKIFTIASIVPRRPGNETTLLHVCNIILCTLHCWSVQHIDALSTLGDVALELTPECQLPSVLFNLQVKNKSEMW